MERLKRIISPYPIKMAQDGTWWYHSENVARLVVVSMVFGGLVGTIFTIIGFVCFT